MKRLFRFPVSSGYLEKEPGCKLACLQGTSSAAEGSREGMTTGGRIGGWRESGVEWEYIFSLSVFARRELERPRTHIHTHTHTHTRLVLGRRPKFKARISGAARYFIGRDQRTPPSSRRSYIHMCMFIAMR